MKVHVVYEVAKVLKGNGVNTVFVQMIDLLKKNGDIDVVINGRGRGDIYHAHSYGLFYFLWGIGYKGRRILSVHVIPDSAKGSIPGWRLMMPLIRWYFRQVYYYYDVFIAVSHIVYGVIRYLSVKTRIVMICNQIPIDFWRYTAENRKKGRARLGLKESDFVVLGVGQLEGRKGVEDFLDIAAAIPEAKFVWVGGRPFGPLTEGLIRINNRIAQASQQIFFPGMFELADMPLVYAASDVFIFPSYQENCPMAPLEAAACGLPVVFRDLPEYALLYENPYLKASTTKEFVQIIRSLMNDSDCRHKGIKISNQLVEQFEEDKIRIKLIGIYTELYRKSSLR
ncbi:MAG: glycosyltransferase family 4 protein [Bacteroidia bacterium]|nr:glycosyltransferase family 4 protein [Bacteroidia bacterium]